MKKKEIRKEIIDLKDATSINDITTQINKSLKFGNNYDGTLDSLYKNVEKMENNVEIEIVNPTVYDNNLVRYLNVVRCIFFGFDKFDQNKRFYMKDAFKKVFLVFIFYSFIGWLVENFVEIVINGWTYMPREVLRGPICPIFGIGAVILLIFLDKYLSNEKVSVWKKIPPVFIGSTIITSILEYFTSYYLEATTGTWPWKSYANQIFNLNGRIALENSLGFGLISTIGLLFIQPKVVKWIKDMKYDMIFDFVYYLIWILFILDLIFAVLAPTGVKLDIVRTSWR